MEENKRKYTVTEAAKILNVSRQTLYHYIDMLKDRGEIIDENSKTLISDKGIETLKKLNIGKKFKEILPELLKDDILNDEGEENSNKNKEEKSILIKNENQNEEIKNIITPENFKELLKNFVAEYDYLKGRLIEEENKGKEKDELISRLNSKIDEKDAQIIKLSDSISDFLVKKSINKPKHLEGECLPIENKSKAKQQKKKNSLFNRFFK